MAFLATVSRHHSLTLAEEDCHSPTANVAWALFNLVVGYILFRVGKVASRGDSALVVFFAGIVVISTVLSVRFAKKQAK
jgi:hypothetical protein